MKSLILVFEFYLLSSFYGSAAAGDTLSSCLQFCKQTFAVHTVPKPGDWDSCEQGCRYAMLLQFSLGLDNLTEVRNECSKRCNETVDVVVSSACNLGCKEGAPLTSGEQPSEVHMVIQSSVPLTDLGSLFSGDIWKKLDDNFNQGFKRMKNIFKLDNFPPVFDEMEQRMSSMRKFMSDTFNGIFNNVDAGGDQIIPVSSEEKSHESSEVQEALNPLYQYAVGQKQTASNAKEGATERLQGRIPFDSSSELVGNKDNNGDDILIVRMIPIIEVGEPSTMKDSSSGSAELKIQDQPSAMDNNLYANDNDNTIDPNDTWINCLARQSSRVSFASRWLLFIAMLLCMVSMIWICIAIIRGVPKRRKQQVFGGFLPFGFSQKLEKNDQIMVVSGDVPFNVDSEKQPLTLAFNISSPDLVVPPPAHEFAPPPYVQNAALTHKLEKTNEK